MQQSQIKIPNYLIETKPKPFETSIALLVSGFLMAVISILLLNTTQLAQGMESAELIIIALEICFISLCAFATWKHAYQTL